MDYKYGLLKYKTNNVGDEIQSIAAKQFLPRVDMYLDRDELHKVKSDKKIKVIMNGWFTHKPENWPPSPDIEPLFVSFHISRNVADRLMTKGSIEYFKKHEPIGCRDYYTRDLLRNKGIDAYFSGCLTLTLKKRSAQKTNQKIIVDVDKNLINKVNLNLHQIETLEHILYPKTANKIILSSRKKYPQLYKMLKKYNLTNTIKKFLRNIFNSYYQQTEFKKNSWKKAEQYLKKYSQAELVITSRLHCALPCTAFETPVIFIHSNLSDERFSGLLQYLNAFTPKGFLEKIDTIDWKKTTMSENEDLRIKKENIEKKCRDFIKN